MKTCEQTSPITIVIGLLFLNLSSGHSVHWGCAEPNRKLSVPWSFLDMPTHVAKTACRSREANSPCQCATPAGDEAAADDAPRQTLEQEEVCKSALRILREFATHDCNTRVAALRHVALCPECAVAVVCAGGNEVGGGTGAGSPPSRAATHDRVAK